jgi:transcriptional regulator with XRE-family HTH domain
MVNSATLKTKRTSAGIPGVVLCMKLGIARSRLSDIERGYVSATPEDLARIDVALEDLIRAKSAMQQTAAELGWPSVELTL